MAAPPAHRRPAPSLRTGYISGRQPSSGTTRHNHRHSRAPSSRLHTFTGAMMRSAGGALALAVAALLVCCSADPHQEQDVSGSEHNSGERYDAVDEKEELEAFRRFLTLYENYLEDRNAFNTRNGLGGLGGSSLLGRDLGSSRLNTHNIGGSTILGRNLDSLGGGNFVRNLDSLGGANFVRNLDSIGGSNFVRNLDSIGGGNFVRSLDPNGRPHHGRNLDSIGGGNLVRNLEYLGRNYVKKNLDQLGGPNLIKKNLDSLGGGNFVRTLDSLGGGNLVR